MAEDAQRMSSGQPGVGAPEVRAYVLENSWAIID
jgi:hypothetical protein